MMLSEMPTTREASGLASRIVQCPDSMILWLKFANDKLSVNSACTNDHLIQWGEPHRLPPGRGLYRNWGGFFDFGDSIEIPGGITVPSVLLEQWSISFWVILPMTMFDTKRKHVLVQNFNGKGAYIQIDETLSSLECICEDTGRTVSA